MSYRDTPCQRPLSDSSDRPSSIGSACLCLSGASIKTSVRSGLQPARRRTEPRRAKFAGLQALSGAIIIFCGLRD